MVPLPFGLYRFCASLVSLVVLATPLLWSQKPIEAIPTEKVPERFLDRRVPPWPLPEAGTRPNSVQKGLSVSPEATKGPSGLRVKFFTPSAGDYRYFNNQISSDTMQPSETVESLGNSRHLTSSSSNQWLKPTFGINYPATQATENLHKYASHFRWVVPIMLRVSQEASKEARAHPHVTSVIKLFRPTF